MAALAPSAAQAGQPFLTDDPEPTDTGHCEVYSPQFDAEGIGDDFAGSLELEFDCGPTHDVQLTLNTPMAYTHDARGWHWAAGDLGLSVKYRFYHDDDGLQVALFPAVTLPTASKGMGAGRVTALLPVWAQQDWGNWSLFGGGGYAINPGAGNRDYWTGGIALSRQLSERWLVGAEAQHDGPDTVGGNAVTRLGVAAICDLPGAPRLMASGGPTFEHGGATGFHLFAALNLVF